MSLYTDYQKKIAPWAKAWHFVVKHKVLILSACAAVFVATGTLLGIKGIVIEDGLNVDMNFAYGESYRFDGGAIMGDVHYEYRPVGSEEWTEVQPTDAGTYEVRACSKNSFGGTYYSEYKTFSIAKKDSPLSIVGTQLMYGEKPTLSMEMASGDQIASYDYDFDDVTKDSPIVTIKDVVIKNAAGKNVTSNYEFSLPNKEMELLKRAITIKGDDIVEEYNGSPVEGGKYTITSGSLATGDKIVESHNTLPVFSSSVIENLTGIRIENGSGVDVTKHYNLSFSKGSLSIIKRNLTITSATVTKVYDGKPFSPEENPELERYTLSQELALGDNISVTFAPQNQKNVGEYDNEFSFNLDNSDNYAVEKVVGKAKITKRQLTLNFVDSLTYNGEVFEDRKDQLCTVNGLVPGHRIELEFINGTAFFPNRTGVDVTVFSDTDEDVTDNYEIIQNGWTEFRKQPLMVDCADVNVVYDGEEHKGSYTVTGLLDCDEIEFNDAVPSSIYPTAIEYTMSIKRIYNHDTGESRTAYYDISMNSGVLIIDKRHISIDATTKRYYTGRDSITRDFDETEYSMSGDGLADGDTLRVFPVFNKGYEAACEIKNREGNDVTDTCYDVSFVGAGAKYEKAELTVTAVDQTLTYDGNWHSLEYSEDGLCAGDTIFYEEKPSYKNVYEYGEYITPRINHIENADGEDVTDFYEITTKTGTLTINIRPLEISIHTQRTYNGTDECLSEYLTEGEEYEFINGTSLADSDEMVLRVDDWSGNYKETMSAFYDNSQELFPQREITDKTTGEGTGFNYDVCFVDPTFNNSKADLRVKSKDVNVVYDGNAHMGEPEYFGLQGTDRIYYVTASWPSTVKPDEIPYEIEVSKILADDNTARTDYYNITTEPGTLRVNKRDVSIDIVPHSDPAIWRYSSNSPYELAAFDRFDITPRIGDGGEIEYDCKIFNDEGEDVTQSCYNLTVNNQGQTRYYYSINAQIDGSTSLYNAPYDGYEHYFSANVVKDDSLDDAFQTQLLASGDKVGTYNNNKLSEYKPCEITATPLVKSITGDRYSNGQYTNGDTSMFYYDPTSTTPATLKIEKRNLTISVFGTRIYQGTKLGYPLEDGEYALGGLGLAPTDEIEITPKEDTILTGGSVEYEISIYNSHLKTDVTDCYDITLDDSMSYQKATLTLTSNAEDNTWDYDGKSHNPVITTNACDGDKAYVSTDISEQGGEVNAGTYDFTTTGVTIKRGNDDVSKYYDIANPNYGSSMTINKVDLYLTIDCRDGFDTSTYDSLRDLAIGYDIQTSTGVTGLELMAIGFEAIPSTPGVYNVEDFVRSAVIMKDGLDVTRNFNIHIQGQFRIVEAHLTISAPTYSQTYNGEEMIGDVERCLISFTKGMAEEGYKVLDIVLEGSIIEPGSVVLRIVSYTIVDGKGNVVTMPVTQNDGTLTITVRSIVIATKDIHDYVGETFDPMNPYIISGSLAQGDRIYFTRSGTPVTSYDSTGEYSNDGWTWVIVDEDGNDVTYRYNITVLWGTIYIED